MLVLQFWYVDAPKRLFGMLREIFDFALQLFSLPLLIHTFFRPIKNEYRKDLVIFSVIFWHDRKINLDNYFSHVYISDCWH